MGLRVVGLHVVGLTVPDVEAGVMLNQLIFQPSHTWPMALMPKDWEPAFRFTVCETVVHFCIPPVLRIKSDPYTGVPPALSSCKLPPLQILATRYATVYIPVV